MSARWAKPPGWSTPKARARRALGLEVRQLLAAHAELLPERPLRPDRVAGDAVELHALLGQLSEQGGRALIQL